MMNYIFIILILLILSGAMVTLWKKDIKGILLALDIQREQIEKLQEIHRKQSEDLASLIASLDSIQGKLSIVLDSLTQNGHPLEKALEASLRNEDCVIDTQTNNKFNDIETVPQEKIFYAKAYDETDRQIVEEKKTSNASSTMPFKITSNGYIGTIVFNTESYSEVAKNIQVQVFPFCLVAMKIGGNPQGIENVEPGKVEYINNEWIIVKQPSIKVI